MTFGYIIIKFPLSPTRIIPIYIYLYINLHKSENILIFNEENYLYYKWNELTINELIRMLL